MNQIKKKVIGFTGLSGTGKSSAIDAIRDLGPIITMGDVVRQEAIKRGIESTDENLGKIARELREKEGQDIIAQKCVELINEIESDVIFIDGVRSLAEVNVFRDIWKFPLIATVIDELIRFKRLHERGRSDDPKTLEELRKRDEREVSFGLKEVVEIADYKIENTSTVEELQKKTKYVVLKIIEGK